MMKIKSLTKYLAAIDKNDNPINEFKRYRQEFDEHQNCIKEIEYTSNGDVESASGYKFNEQNKMIEEIHYFEGNEIGEHIKYSLDEEGKPDQIETIYADDAKSIKKIKRFEHKVSVEIFDEDGEKEGEETIKFDSKGRPIEEVQIDDEQNITQRSVFEYGDSDKVINRIDYGENDEFLVKINFEYDKEGHLLKIIQQSEKGQLISANNFEYDERGNQVLLQNNQQLQRTSYDEQNRIVSKETVNGRNNMVENFTEYKYGNHGHIVEERNFSMGDAYQLEPGVFSRTASDYLLTRYEYEFYDD